VNGSVKTGIKCQQSFSFDLSYLLTYLIETLSESTCKQELLGLSQICQHNKMHNRPEYYAGIMLA